jgi:coenzyme Q-binding protein COQ10
MQKIRCFFKVSQRRQFNPFSRDKPNNVYIDNRIIGYSPKQLYDVVIDVEKYKQFIPLCEDSKILKRNDKSMEAELKVNFKLGAIAYISNIQFENNKYVHVVVKEQHWLFKHLKNTWEFEQGPTADSCLVKFKVDFEFTSTLYQSFAEAFISTSCKTMTSSFEERCKVLYGNPSKGTQILHTSH